MNAPGPAPAPAMFRCTLRRVAASDRRRTMVGGHCVEHWAPLQLVQELPASYATAGTKVYLDLSGAGRTAVPFGYTVETAEPTTLKWFWPPYLLAGGADTYGDV